MSTLNIENPLMEAWTAFTAVLNPKQKLEEVSGGFLIRKLDQAATMIRGYTAEVHEIDAEELEVLSNQLQVFQNLFESLKAEEPDPQTEIERAVSDSFKNFMDAFDAFISEVQEERLQNENLKIVEGDLTEDWLDPANDHWDNY